MCNMKIAVLVLAVASCSSSLRQKRQEDDGPTQDPISASLGLSSGSRDIRENLVDTFTCDGLGYGYYADVDNDCQMFHICYPVTYPDGQEEMFKWSFLCPNQTIFDQSTLVCTFPLDALPCEDAPSFYTGPDSINDKFGRISEDEK